MKFVVSSNTMLTRLQAVSKVIGGKPVQPILDNILLVATNGLLYACLLYTSPSPRDCS